MVGIEEGYRNKGGGRASISKGMKREDLIFPKSLRSPESQNRNISPFAHAG